MRHFSPALHANVLLGLLLPLAAWQTNAGPKVLPDAVAHAHTIFVENETGFAELQNTAILELSKWGRYETVESREKADVVMRLDGGSHVRALPDGQYPSPPGVNALSEEEIPRGHTRIALLDPKTNAVLWWDAHKTEGGKVKNGHLLDGLREAVESYDKSRAR